LSRQPRSLPQADECDAPKSHGKNDLLMICLFDWIESRQCPFSHSLAWICRNYETVENHCAAGLMAKQPLSDSGQIGPFKSGGRIAHVALPVGPRLRPTAHA